MKTINNRLREYENKINDKISTLYKIETTINFDKNKDFMYVFNIYKNDKLKKTISLASDEDFDLMLKQLEQKYNTKIQFNFENLSDSELRYLLGEVDKIF